MTDRPTGVPTAPPFPAEPPAPPAAVVAGLSRDGDVWPEVPHEAPADPVDPPPRRTAVAPRAVRTRMGPWAPVAGAALGLVVGVLVVVLALAPVAAGFPERLAAVFLCLGLTLLGAGGVLLADEVRVRRSTVGAQSVSEAAGLLNGLTPARLLVGAAGFVLLLAAYVVRG